MSKKIVKLTESDLERIVQKVVQEQGLGARVKATAAGIKGGAEERDKQRQVRKANRETEKTQRADARELARQKSILQSLNSSVGKILMKQINNVNRQLTDKGLQPQIQGDVESYINYITNLKSTLDQVARNAGSGKTDGTESA
jgi:hypothetical protein